MRPNAFTCREGEAASSLGIIAELNVKFFFDIFCFWRPCSHGVFNTSHHPCAVGTCAERGLGME